MAEDDKQTILLRLKKGSPFSVFYLRKEEEEKEKGGRRTYSDF